MGLMKSLGKLQICQRTKWKIIIPYIYILHHQCSENQSSIVCRAQKCVVGGFQIRKEISSNLGASEKLVKFLRKISTLQRISRVSRSWRACRWRCLMTNKGWCLNTSIIVLFNSYRVILHQKMNQMTLTKEATQKNLHHQSKSIKN